ncbi:helix-turn-helix domain-containing protein [Streptomyces sp. NPDC032472]|uniref:GlxA family transcriptional regulator n=1 Tax=Streptomyces sp. NPDC032472 TaxID=3155018 RepID=UPI0033E3A305
MELVGSAAHRTARRVLAGARERRTPLATACTGTFLLAQTGVLDGLRAATSWWLAPVFRERHARVAVDESRMATTCDGITPVGAAFGHLDLALAIVRMRSPALADLVRRYLVVGDRAAQAPYTIPSALARHDPLVSAFEQWVRSRIGEPLSIAEAARGLGVSERTLQRTVTRTLGCSPVRLVQDLRVEQAEHLLRTTALPLAALARRVGYESPGPLLRDRLGRSARSLRGRDGLPVCGSPGPLRVGRRKSGRQADRGGGGMARATRARPGTWARRRCRWRMRPGIVPSSPRSWSVSWCGCSFRSGGISPCGPWRPAARTM